MIVLVVGFNNCGQGWRSLQSNSVLGSQSGNPTPQTSAAETPQNQPLGIVLDQAYTASEQQQISKFEILSSTRDGELEVAGERSERLTYVPSADFHGMDGFTFRMRFKDGTFSSPTTMEIRVLASLNISMIPGDLPPQQLSATGLLDGSRTRDPDNLLWSKEAIPYEVNHRLWTDYASKVRMVLLPPGQKARYSDDLWDFPIGTIIVKSFSLAISATTDQPLETRILVRKSLESPDDPTGGWEGYSYRWIDNDATLVDDNLGTNTFDIEVANDAPGGGRTQTYSIPTRAQCLTCHNSTVGYIRGLRTNQINTMPNAFGYDRLGDLAALDFFENPLDIPADKSQLPKLTSLNQIGASTESKVRSYLSVHCSHCHNANPAAPCNQTGDDFRFANFDVETLTSANPGLGRSQRIVSGDAEGSSLYDAVSSGRMPQIGTAIVNPAFSSLLRDWIENDLQ